MYSCICGSSHRYADQVEQCKGAAEYSKVRKATGDPVQASKKAKEVRTQAHQESERQRVARERKEAAQAKPSRKR